MPCRCSASTPTCPTRRRCRLASPMVRRGATTSTATSIRPLMMVWKHWRTLIDEYEVDHPGQASGHDQRVVRHARTNDVVLAGRRVPPELRVRADVDHLAGQADARRDRRFARHARVGRRRTGVDPEQPRHTTHRHSPRTAQRQRSGGVDRQQPPLRRCARSISSSAGAVPRRRSR